MRERGGAALVVGLLLVALASGPSAAEERHVDVPVTAASWFHSHPAASRHGECALTVLCDAPLPPSANPYPEDTLHVAAAGGRETARSYLRFDVAVLPAAGRITQATLLLPLADLAAGSVRGDTAVIDACLAVAPFPAARGGAPADAPGVDCGVTAAADYDDAAGVFRVDVTPFIGVWRRGAPNHGLALLARREPPDAWHAAFRHERSRGTAAQIAVTAAVSLPAAPLLPPAPAPAPASPPPVTRPAVPSAPPPPLQVASAVEAPGLLPELVVPPGTVPAPPADAVSRVVPGASYPAVWWLPLVLIALGAALTRSFTREMAVAANPRVR